MPNRYGTSGNDIITGTGEIDSFYGLGGMDTLLGRGGYDFLDGGSGDDLLDGGDDNDDMYGGIGADRLIGGKGNDYLYGGAGRDTVHGGDNEDNLDGGAGDDVLYGDKGSDFIDGGSGNDQLLGGDDTSNDLLYGSYGSDTLIGRQGGDYLDGWTRSNYFEPPIGERSSREVDILHGNNADGSRDGRMDTFILGLAPDDMSIRLDQGVFYTGSNQYAVIDDFAIGEDLIRLSGEPVIWTEDDSSLDTEKIPVDGVSEEYSYYSEVSLDKITGELSNHQYNNGVKEDLFCITVGPGLYVDSKFSATTVGLTNLDTILTLYDLDGNVITSNDNSNGSNQSTITLDELTGEYLIGLKTSGQSTTGSYAIDFTGVKANVVANYEVLDITEGSFSHSSGIYHNNDLIAVLNNHSAGEFNLADASQFTYI